MPTYTITTRPCQDLSYPQVTREPPDGCPQQLRSLPCLCVGALSPQASLHPQELKGIHRWGSGGGNSKSTGAVGLLMVGTSPVTGSRDKRSGTPGTSRAASPGLFLPPQSRAAPALRPNSPYRQMPGSTPRPPPASPTPQNPHGQDPMHHPLVPGGWQAPRWI